MSPNRKGPVGFRLPRPHRPLEPLGLRILRQLVDADVHTGKWIHPTEVDEFCALSDNEAGKVWLQVQAMTAQAVVRLATMTDRTTDEVLDDLWVSDPLGVTR